MNARAKVKVKELRRCALGRRASARSADARHVAFSPDGTEVAVAFAGRRPIAIVRAGGCDVDEPRCLAPPGGDVIALGFRLDGALAVAGSEGEIALHERGAAGEPARRVAGLRSHGPAAFSPGATALVAWPGGLDVPPRVLSLESGRAWDLRPRDEPGSTSGGGGDDYTCSVYGQNSEIEYEDDIFALAFSPDGGLIASLREDRRLTLFHWSGGEYGRFHLRSWTSAIAFSPDGKLVAAGAGDRVLALEVRAAPKGGGDECALWTSAAPAHGLGDLLGERVNRSVYRLAASPGARVFAGACLDGAVRLWDADTGAPAGEAAAHERGKAYAVAFSPAGFRLASASSEGELIVVEIER